MCGSGAVGVCLVEGGILRGEGACLVEGDGEMVKEGEGKRE